MLSTNAVMNDASPRLVLSWSTQLWDNAFPDCSAFAFPARLRKITAAPSSGVNPSANATHLAGDQGRRGTATRSPG